MNDFKIIFSFQKVPESKWRCKVSENALGGEGADNHLLNDFHKKADYFWNVRSIVSRPAMLIGDRAGRDGAL